MQIEVIRISALDAVEAGSKVGKIIHQAAFVFADRASDHWVKGVFRFAIDEPRWVYFVVRHALPLLLELTFVPGGISVFAFALVLAVLLALKSLAFLKPGNESVSAALAAVGFDLIKHALENAERDVDFW
ncbi:hypothetical protein MYX77_00995 [Acidobacteriia bacterium AH_259_A11_L15]|nr:hypothetical protein [Acidobacteriia bacterium AH_259_A11_L15]